jgi:hypothetical protein
MSRNSVERRLRKVASKRLETDETIGAWCRVWYSHPARVPVISARFRDFAVVTDRRLLLFESKWLTRRPGRRVLADRLDALTISGSSEPTTPIRRIRVLHPNHAPVILDFGSRPAAQTVARLLHPDASIDAGTSAARATP